MLRDRCICTFMSNTPKTKLTERPHNRTRYFGRPRRPSDELSTSSEHPIALRVAILQPIEEYNVPVQPAVVVFLHRRPERIANK